MIRAFFSLLLLATANGNLTTFKIDEECLNFTVYPVQYELTIKPRIYTTRSFEYNCELVITVIANAPQVTMIELEAKDLGIQSVNVYREGYNIINRNSPYNHNTTIGKLYIYLSEPLKEYKVYKIQYQIKIRFKKIMYYDTPGVFVVKYDDQTGIKYMILTRLSRGHAKYFFPCFGNDRFEAVFKFRVNTLTGAHGMQFTNTSLVIAPEQRRTSDKDGYNYIEYLPSPQVYLNEVGFVYCQFANASMRARNTNDTLVIWAPGHHLRYYHFILKFGQAIMNLIHDYAKIDRVITNGPINVVSVPSELHGGYEVSSWNLWTNGDFRLKYVPGLISIGQVEKMTFDFTQQMCRVWLGNPGEDRRTYWREEWFKEGMATYFAYYFLGKYHHNEESYKSGWPYGFYGLEMRHKAMNKDSLDSTPALINFNRTLAVDIPSRHKQLVSMKTAALLWMVENWIGTEKFHAALVKYINMRRGSYITLDDFMINLDKETVECFHQFSNGTTTSMVLSSWIRSAGYPIINVQVYRDGTRNTVMLKQRTFSFTNEHRYDTNYLIPISYTAQNHQSCYNCHQPRFIISTHIYSFVENLDGGWILLNRQASGYYRVNYDEETWRLIAKTLHEEHTTINELNRAQIVNDVFAIYTAGDLSYELALEILSYLEEERSYAVWEAAIAGFELLKTNNAACNFTQALYEAWKRFMRKNVKAVYESLVEDLEQQPQTRLFRSNIITFACDLQFEPCLSRVREHYDPTRRYGLEPDSRQACYYTVLRDKGEEAYQLRIANLTSFENEDRTIARHRSENEQKLMYRLPVGSEPSEYLMVSSTPRPSITPTALAPQNNQPDSSSSLQISIACIILAYFVTAIC